MPSTVLFALLLVLPSVQAVLVDCNSSTVLISEVQGNGLQSPKIGQVVTIKGIVTADLQSGYGTTNGFYVQENGAGDQNKNTSDGIFVFEASKSVSLGDVIVLAGTVQERNGQTQIEEVANIAICASNQQLPKPVVLTHLPNRVNSSTALEPFEGMLVRIPEAIVTDVENLASNSEVRVSTAGRSMAPTQIWPPGQQSALYEQAFEDGSYRVNVLGSPQLPTLTFRSTNPRRPPPAPVAGCVSIATFTALDYFNGPFPGARGAASAGDFAAQRGKVLAAITALDPAVVGLTGVENDGYGPASAVRDLVTGLNGLTFAGKYSLVDPGRATLGAGATAVHLLYQPDRVALAGAAAVLDAAADPGYDSAAQPPALAQSFVDARTGAVFTVAVASLVPRQPCTGDAAGDGDCAGARRLAAMALGRWLSSDPTGSRSPYFLLTGALNAYAKEEAVAQLTSAPLNLTDAVARSAAAGQAYTAVTRGWAGYLDHALASPSLAPRVAAAAVWHANADEPVGLALTGDGPYRSAARDPVVVSLDLGTGGASVEIWHVNDHHSHLDPTSLDLFVGGNLTRMRVGGFPALVGLLRAAPAGALKVHAGDALTGTAYYSLYQGKADAALMGEACFDTFTLGNHEFDDGDAALRDFLDLLRAGPCAGTSVLSANVRPAPGTPLAPVTPRDYVLPWTNRTLNGTRVAVVAGLTVRNKTVASSRPWPSTVFLEEVRAAQDAIDEATARGFDKVVLATHVGYAADLDLARRLRGVDVIVGGDSHTLLGDGSLLGLPAEGPYPTLARDADGRLVCIGQAWEYSKAVGRLTVEFDREGHVMSCAGQVTLPVPKNSRIVEGIVGTPRVTKYNVQVPPSLYVRYEGSNAYARSDFAEGFPAGFGSGLQFKGKVGDTLYFYGLTDRGPNGDAPKKTNATALAPYGYKSLTTIGKVFTAPSFAPQIGLIKVNASGAFLESSVAIRRPDEDGGAPISGRPPTPDPGLVMANAYGFLLTGAVGEVPLHDNFTLSSHDPDGLDTEALIYDAREGAFWVSDEYGPFLVKVNGTTGAIQKKYYPGRGFPAVLSKRRSNRGIEGMCMDPVTGNIHGFLQSPIDPLDATGSSIKATPPGGSSTNIRNVAKFVRWFEFDPRTESSKLYALPINGADFANSRTGEAKLGDLVCLGGGRFVTIYQGTSYSGPNFNWLSTVRIPPGVTDITGLDDSLETSSITGVPVNGADYSKVVGLETVKLLDLNALGWTEEKCEGLAMIDDYTLAITNDNDFGLRAILTNADGSERVSVSGSNVEDNCAVTAGTGAFYGRTSSCKKCCDSTCDCGDGTPRITRKADMNTTLWIVRFARSLREFDAAVTFQRMASGSGTFAAVDPVTAASIEATLAVDNGRSIQAKVVEVSQNALRALQNFSDPMLELYRAKVGRANDTLCLVRIPGTRDNLNPNSEACFNQTREHGSAVTQLVAEAFLASSRRAHFSLQNAGGVRTGIAAGDISYELALSVLPFTNTLVELDLTGREVLNALEEAAQFARTTSSGSHPYAAGLRWCFNASAPQGSRFSALEARMGQPGAPETAWSPLDLAGKYTVVANDYIAGGKDGYATLKTASDDGRAINTYVLYSQALINYLRQAGTVGLPASSDYAHKDTGKCAASSPSSNSSSTCGVECCTRPVSLAKAFREIRSQVDRTLDSVELCAPRGRFDPVRAVLETGAARSLAMVCVESGSPQDLPALSKVVRRLSCPMPGRYVSLETPFLAVAETSGSATMRVCWRSANATEVNKPWDVTLSFNFAQPCGQ